MLNNGCRKVGVIARCVDGDSVSFPQIKIKEDAEQKSKDECNCTNAKVFVLHCFAKDAKVIYYFILILKRSVPFPHEPFETQQGKDQKENPFQVNHIC